MIRKEKSLRLLWELLTVTLGVFLALFANSYYEKQKEEQLVEKVLDALIREVQQNRQIVTRSLEFHKEFLTKLDTDPENLVLQLNTAPIIKSAWDAAQSSGVLHLLDYDLALAFSETYSWHEEYDKLKFLSDQALYFVRFSDPKYNRVQYLKRWESAFQDFKYTEEQLIRRYTTVLWAFKELSEAGA